MAVFDYVAYDNKGGVFKGKIEAADIREARQNVRQLGYTPTEITLHVDANAKDEEASKTSVPALSLKEKLDFTTTFNTLQKAGLPIIESLVFMEQNAASRRSRVITKEIKQQVISGTTFSDSVAKFQKIFGAVYIGLVKAGEESGEMEKTLDRLVDLLKKEEAIRGKIISALTYPCFVVLLAIGAVIVMLMFVFPAFKDMFEGAGADLPIITQICMDSGEFLKAKWPVIPIGLVTIFFTIKFLFSWEVSRAKIDEYSIKLPLLGNLFKFSQFSNFLSVLYVAYEAGIPVVDCLYLSNMTFTNGQMNKLVNVAIKKVQGGMNLSTALKLTTIFPQMIVFMVSTGEQSGRLGDLLDECVKFIDQELDKAVDTITKMIEPILLIFIGCLVCFLALALYLPLFQSYQL